MRRRGWLSTDSIYFAFLVMLLYLPVTMLVIFSFNDSHVLAFPLRGFTLENFAELLRTPELLTSVRNSLVLAIVSSLVATVLGTMAAIGITRYRFPGRGAFLAVCAMPMVIPYVVMGVALLIGFDAVGIPLSLWTVCLGHVVINLPYVVLIVAARLVGFDANLEEAAMDLGATYWGTLLRVTLPLTIPALIASLLTTFTTSFNEFAVAFFLIGTETTMPIYLYSQLRFPKRLPLVVSLAAVILISSVSMLLFAERLRRADQPAIQKGKP